MSLLIGTFPVARHSLLHYTMHHASATTTYISPLITNVAHFSSQCFRYGNMITMASMTLNRHTKKSTKAREDEEKRNASRCGSHLNAEHSKEVSEML